jgi:amino acid transporter
MTMEEFHFTSASEPERVAPAITRSEAMEALKDGPRGALFIAACAASLLFLGWLFFYFVLFMSRGQVG